MCSYMKVRHGSFYNGYPLWRHRHQQSNESTPVFMPITVTSAAEVDSRSFGCVIEYPNGVTLRLAGPVNVSLLTQLIVAKAI